MSFINKLTKDFKLMGILIIVGLFIEVLTLIWIHHIAFLSFVVGGLCLVLGMLLFVVKIFFKTNP